MNAATYIPPDFPGGALAPGAMISIFGANLGPPEGVQASGFPLPTELGGTEVIIENTRRCYLLYVSAQQVNCQLPPDLDRDRIHLFLRTRDRDQIRDSAPVDVPMGGANIGMFAMNGYGRGPAAALNHGQGPGPEYQYNGPGATARRGQVVLMYGTGLGATDPMVPGGQASAGLVPAVEQPQVFVGGVAAQVQYAGRAPGFAGLDQIQIVVPENAPEGCSVPVRLRIRDRIHNRSRDSNITTLAIHATGLRCTGPLEDVDQGSHGTVVLASGLGRLGPGQQGPGGPGPGGGMGGHMGPVGYGMHPGIPPHAFGYGFQMGRGNGPDVIAARFVRFGGLRDVGLPPVAADSCIVYYQGPRANPDLFLGAAELLDAGALTLRTPRSTITVMPDTVAGLGVLYAEPLPEPLAAGSYTLSGAGGVDVGPFGPVNLAVPAMINMTSNLANGTVIARGAPLTLNWSGGGANDIVVIHGRSYRLGPGVRPPVSYPSEFRSMAFLCSAAAGAGGITVPVHVLEQLPGGQLSLTVTHMPSAQGLTRFEAGGLELGGVFRWLSTATYPNLVLSE